MARLCRTAFGDAGPSLVDLTDVNRGRGAFSVVLRAELSWPDGGGETPNEPASVVAKLPADGPNRDAAIAAGAYRREALAYRRLLGDAPIATPLIHHVEEPDDGTCSILMEDLSGHRSFDQLIGLPSEVALQVAAALALFHRSWPDDGRLAELPVRRNTVAALPGVALTLGLEALETRWSDRLDDGQRRLYRRLVDARHRVVERFDAIEPTLCHGDPRADNFVFDDRGRLVLFDWQQLAVQFGEADLAWLAATSLEVDVRRRLDRELVAAYGGSEERYRLGLALPGLAVLMLAQRQLETDRTERFVAASLQRIAAALADLDVLDLF